MQASDYSALITSEHANQPKYAAMVSVVAQCWVDLQNTLGAIPPAYDLDAATGAQLDAVGLWVGLSRNISAPIAGVYFSLDTVNLGFDQGNWQGPFDPSNGLVSLDDDTYRTLLYAKIGANNWDGTLNSSAAILSSIFGDTGTYIFLQDNSDMSVLLGLSGTIPSALFLALLKGGYLPLKPEGVHINSVMVTSVNNDAIFGFDVNNNYVGGFDTGAWGTPQ